MTSNDGQTLEVTGLVVSDRDEVAVIVDGVTIPARFSPAEMLAVASKFVEIAGRADPAAAVETVRRLVESQTGEGASWLN